MPTMNNAADVLCEALRKRQKLVALSSHKSVNALLKEAYEKDKRLIGCVKNYTGQRQSSGMFGLNKDYQVKIEYVDDIVKDVDDVIVDDGTWKPSQVTFSYDNMPTVIQIVTQDVNGLMERINGESQTLRELCPGLQQVNYEWSIDAYTKYHIMLVKFQYAVSRENYKTYHVLATREMERICRSCFGDKHNIPKVIRVFLAFSYLQQTCAYDHETFDLLSRNQEDSVKRPWVNIPYGALVQKMAICEGIASAFKMFMDYYGITNRIVFGCIKDDNTEHCWNMVCLDKRYYHIDVTFGIEGDGIYIGSFLKDDNSMAETHSWNFDDYPACAPSRLDYDYVEDYIGQHMDDLIRMGVEDRYLCPDEVRA